MTPEEHKTYLYEFLSGERTTGYVQKVQPDCIGFKVKSAEVFLTDPHNRKAIDQIFCWMYSPQGEKFWRNLYNGDTPENIPEAQEYVKWLLAPQVVDDDESVL